MRFFEFHIARIPLKRYAYNYSSSNYGSSRVFAVGPGDRGSIPGWVLPKTQKMVLDAALLSIQQQFCVVARTPLFSGGGGLLVFLFCYIFNFIHTLTRARVHTHTHTQIFIYIYICIWISIKKFCWSNERKSKYFLKMNRSTWGFISNSFISLQHVFLVFYTVFKKWKY